MRQMRKNMHNMQKCIDKQGVIAYAKLRSKLRLNRIKATNKKSKLSDDAREGRSPAESSPDTRITQVHL